MVGSSTTSSLDFLYMYTVKNVKDFPVKLSPARESFVSDIPAGDGKIALLFTVYAWSAAYVVLL